MSAEILTGSSTTADSDRQILQQLVFESLKEQKKARRWGIFFKIFVIAYLLLIFIMVASGRSAGPPSGNYTALVDLDGIIMASSKANADDIGEALRNAFASDGTKGVILRANSPGGSPVQAGYLYNEIKRLRKKYPKIPIYAVVMDYCASACYYIASATNKIYANQASTVGSIGVLYNTFGYVKLMDKIGVERRLLTAGKHKGFLDPFSPMTEKAKKHAFSILNQVHLQFIEAVKQGRGERLTDNADMFSGLYWTGAKAMEIGLVDKLASASEVARDVVKAEKIVDFSRRETLLDSFARKIGESMAQILIGEIRSVVPKIH